MENMQALSLTSKYENSWIGEPWPSYPSIQPLVQTYYPTYYGYWNNESSIEKAFKIIQKLMVRNLVKVETVKDFIELVNEVASVV